MRTVLLILACGMLAGCSSDISFPRTGSRPAGLVVLNARIFTSNPDQPKAKALAVDGKRFCYVGDRKGALDFIGPDTRVVDAGGRRLTPGFVDNHCHVLWIGGLLSMMPASYYACTNWADIEATLRARDKEAPNQPFVGGIGWKMDQVPGGVPRKEILDGVIPDRPVILMSYSGQCGWLNSKAVDLCAERNPAAFESLGPVRDAETGDFTGELQHFHAFNFLDFFPWSVIGESAQAEFKAAMTDAINGALSVGVTTMNDVQIYTDFIPFLLEFRDEGGMDKARFRCSFYVGHERLENEQALLDDLKGWQELDSSKSDAHLNVGQSLKFYIDGTADNRTCFMDEPFSNDPDNIGDPVWSQEDFNRIIAEADRLGLQACTHSIGDAGIHRVVNAYENARVVNGPRDSRHRVEHCEMPRPEDRVRMGKAGILAAMQPTHFYGDAMVEEAFGPERIQRFMPWHSLEKAGVSLSFGSDWCAGPNNPVYGLLIAATRMNYKGDTDWGPKEKVRPEDAVRHWTRDSAYALFMEEEAGSIEVGKWADFVLFNTDPLKVDSLWFLLTHDLDLGTMDDFVDWTVVDGQTVYRKPDVEL